MRVLKVKICGITRAEDARVAVDLGADALGFVFWQPSVRHLEVGQAADIAATIARGVSRVGVFVNAPPAAVAAAVQAVPLDVVQLHGDAPVGSFTSVGARLVRAVALASDEAVERAAALPDDVVPLVDAGTPEAPGGTGRTADWGRAAALATRRPIWLAGGLHAGNVGAAIRHIRPALVDVSSGVESAPGIKDHARLRSFFEAVQRAGKECA
ncbi:MAG TPA: phosphoribosylanthranilate isomerase [Vicinamibacterales bacterium]|nr:phosphoribosylanthranilate isomerase [Vicinamibacterales bacterium]